MAYLVVGVGVEQSLLVAQLGWLRQQEVLQVPLHQGGGQQRRRLSQMLSRWQAGVHGERGSPGGATEGQEPQRQTVPG